MLLNLLNLNVGGAGRTDGAVTICFVSAEVLAAKNPRSNQSVLRRGILNDQNVRTDILFLIVGVPFTAFRAWLLIYI